MNIALLVIGVMLVVCCVILITINSSKETQNQTEIKDTKAHVKSYNSYTPNRKVNLESGSEKEDLFYEKIRDEVLKPSIKEEVKEVKVIKDIEQKETNTKSVEHINLEQQEASVVLDVYKSKDKSENLDEESLTDKIIKMKKEGLGINEIAKKLDKGVREIEIILKINKINY